MANLAGTRSSPACCLAALKVFGPDRKGIVAASSTLLNRCGFSAVQSEHYVDRNRPQGAMFFQRILFDTINRVEKSESDVENGLREIQQRFGVKTELDWRQTPKRVAILVSRYSHCLWELLLRYQANELQQCEIPLVLSNHDDCRRIAQDTFGIPFEVFPITRETKEEQEQKQLELLKQQEIDVIVLARYMQVLSDNFLNNYPERIINIHHSFLPAFSGGRAYHQAHERGVKLIGATAHYATSTLDAGPIIEQDAIHVSHRDTPQAFIRKGQILERSVLVRALQAHLDNRVIVYDNKCVVFGD